ncbi:MAG: NAD(+)/NADH kinase [Candidatus Bathyarchaeia archaeon]
MLLLCVGGIELFNVVAIVARVDRKEAMEFATKLIAHLEEKKLSVFLEPKLAKRAKRANAALPLEKMKTDLIITIGGDGTILRTCLLIPKPEPPILAINMGVRGFLAEVTPKEGIDAVDRCLEGRFTLERCMKLASFIGDTRLPDALNEVFITSRAPAKLLYARIWKDGVAVTECRADGVVVASQVGSTGYSLSGGGPVLDPEVDAFVLTPVCPLTASHPIVFSAKSTINIELLKPKRAAVVIDGYYRTSIAPKHPRITITKSEYESSFVRFKGNFYHRLKGRLLFSRGGGL